MNSLKTILLMTAFTLTVTSCQPDDTSRTTGPADNTPTPPQVSTPLAIASPTNAPTTMSSETMQTQCLETLAELPADSTLSGRLVLEGDQPVYYDFAEDIVQTIPNTRRSFAVSPDRDYLAYVENSSDSPTGAWLIVEGLDGQTSRLALQADWFSSIPPMWLDDQTLLFSIDDGTNTWPAAIINPFSGYVQEFASDYPRMISRDATRLPFGTGAVIFHPSLELVIYPDNFLGDYHIILWNRVQGTLLAQLETTRIYYDPIWLPNGNQFVVPITINLDNYIWNSEWFSVSINGHQSQLTHFADFFRNHEIGGAQVSPNSRYLAFWLKVEPGGMGYHGYNLAILDLETQQLTNYCFPGSSQRSDIKPVWSPDSRYVVVKQLVTDQIILVDTVDGWAARITGVPDNLTPIGWMLSP